MYAAQRRLEFNPPEISPMFSQCHPRMTRPSVANDEAGVRVL